MVMTSKHEHQCVGCKYSYIGGGTGHVCCAFTEHGMRIGVYCGHINPNQNCQHFVRTEVPLKKR
jgi:ornithine carbamoyltransferase